MKFFSKYGKFFGVLLILPLVVMAIYVIKISKNEIAVEDVVAVSVSDERYKHRYSGKDDIEEYVSLVIDSADGAVQDIDSSAASYKIEYEMRNGSTKTYQFYPSLTGKSLIVDGTGKVRSAKDVEALLLREEYDNLFESRFLPSVSVLSTDGKCMVLPTDYRWNFKKTDGKYYPYSTGEKSKENAVLQISAEVLKKGAVSISSSPDEFLIAYTHNGKDYSTVENLSIKDGEKITVTVSARWQKKSNTDFFGAGKWVFECIYKESPIITVESLKTRCGDCIVVYAENIDAGELLEVETELITYKSPKVYKGENRNFALLPIDLTNASGKYDVKVSYEGSDFEFLLEVESVSNGFCMKNVGAEIFNGVSSPDGINETQKFIELFRESKGQDFVWESRDMFSPVSDDAQIDTPFACEVLYNGVPPQVFFEGISYNVEEKTSVKSAAKGKVVFSGETLKTGKALVIDHGWGIMTHYYHLSVLSAFEGEDVDGGKLIALSGKTGYTDKADMYFAVSINGVFVDPNLFLSK